MPSQGELKANTAETRVSCTAVTCAILDHYELKDTLCQWQLNIWLAFHLLGDIFSVKYSDEQGGLSRKEGSFQTFFNFARKVVVEIFDQTAGQFVSV